jgi:hypothetical protein
MNPRIAFVAAPLLTLTYGVIRIIDGLDGYRGPGLAWTAGHLAFLGAMVLFVSVFWQLRGLAGRNVLSTVIAAVATAGAVALFGQFAIDLVAGFLTTDNLAMSLRIFDIRTTTPGVSLALYDVGPYLFYAGQLALVVQLAVTRRINWWTPLLVAFDLVMPNIDKDLIPIGAVVLLISFVPLAKRVPVAPRAVPAIA